MKDSGSNKDKIPEQDKKIIDQLSKQVESTLSEFIRVIRVLSSSHK